LFFLPVQLPKGAAIEQRVDRPERWKLQGKELFTRREYFGKLHSLISDKSQNPVTWEALLIDFHPTMRFTAAMGRHNHSSYHCEQGHASPSASALLP
jgi:hypothetical protein